MSTPKVLLLSHSDGHLEVVSDRGIDIHLQQLPVATSIEGEVLAEEIAYLQTPRRFRALLSTFAPQPLGTTKPVTVGAMSRALAVQDCVDQLNAVLENRGATTWI